VLTIVAAAVLMAGAFAVGKYFGLGGEAKPISGQAPGAAKTAKDSNNSLERKAPPPLPAPASPQEQHPAARKTLSYDEQAKILELNSLADIDERDGGCEKALPVYQQVLDIDPHNARAYNAIRECYAKARNREGTNAVPATTPPAPSPSP
jgi:hypothetical protein